MTLPRRVRPPRSAPSDHIPAGFARRTRRPGWSLHRVPMRIDGIALDHVEAATLFADQPWADDAEYVGSARGFHVFQRPPG